MNHSWLLIVEHQSLSITSKYYKVIAGEGVQAQRDISFLTEYAGKNGFYWHKWDNHAADFLENIIRSLGCKILDLNIHQINARSLVSIIKTTGDTPTKPFLNPSLLKLRSLSMPNLPVKRKINVIRQAEAKERNKPKV